jgi:hypothetical protein
MAFPGDAARVECCADGGMVGETLHNGDDVGVLQKDEPPVAVVIGERAEWFRAKCDLG